MMAAITLSRYKLQTFLDCRRRFALRYQRRLPWPTLPVSVENEAVLARGEQFHRAVERHFLGLPVEPALSDDRLRDWWAQFQRHKPAVPDGRFLPEHTLTIPIGNHLLTGRFDLLVIGDTKPEPFAHIFDWKTGHPPQKAALRDDWQTRLYLGIIAEGGAALLGRDQAIPPERISLTYWYAGAPTAPLVFRYDAAWHAENWGELQAIAAELDVALDADLWPLTDNLELCRRCPYQVFCGRQAAGTTPAIPTEADPDDAPLFPDLDPAIP